MYPERHDDVANLLADDGLVMDFYRNDDPRSSVKEKDTTIMGRFQCDNPACKSNGWSSMKVAITIRLFQRQKYNARVYHQRCKSCNWVSLWGKWQATSEKLVRRVQERTLP